MTDTQPALVVRQHVRASPDRVFDTWTDPEHLVNWWGPSGVECTHAEVDLQVGGMFRIANLAPDGSTIWIAGVYEDIQRPSRLQHTWYVEAVDLPSPERVIIEFLPTPDGTEIVVTHGGIATEPMWQGHRDGWSGCLDGLAELLEEATA